MTDLWADFHMQLGPERCYYYPRRDCPGCDQFCIRIDKPINRSDDDGDDH